MPARRVAARTEPVRARLEGDARRRQLVERGFELFTARAYDEVSIDELATAAGVSKGLLYHYFPTKRDFYLAIVREAARQLLEQTEVASRADPVAALREGLEAYLDYVTRHGRPYAALLRSGVGADPEVGRIVDDTREELCRRLVEGATLPAPGPLARLALRGWIGFVETATLEWLEADPPAVPRDALRDLLAQVLLAALEQATGAR